MRIGASGLGSYALMGGRSQLALVAACGMVILACGPFPPDQSRPARPINLQQRGLSTAILQAVHLGTAGPDTQIHLNLGLKVRRATELTSLLATGRTLSSEAYAAEFGPDPALARSAVMALSSLGFRATWRPGLTQIAVDGPAPMAASLLGIDIENYRLADGTTFYASLDQPRIPPQLATIVSTASGLDSYTHWQSSAVRPGGLTPSDVAAFYNLRPLRDRGLDGSGETIVLPEVDDLPTLEDLNKFAATYGLPPFDLQIKRDPSWGTPVRPVGEVSMDLQIIHEIAPKAKLIVYMSSLTGADVERAFDQLVNDHLGSIISQSIGVCERQTTSGYRSTWITMEDRAVAQGMSHFVATGDTGAYECGFDTGPVAQFPSTLPTVTAVGGTTVFQSLSGAYLKEMAWTAPIDETATGGGSSVFYPLPDYQKRVAQVSGKGMRQVPDVAADADPTTGVHEFFGGMADQGGGTSAAAPLWAATMALINQDLKRKGLREAGFANPALYWMGENSSKLPAPPFHDVTSGNNLADAAGPGWDFATGWGSMDGAALDQAWTIYIKGGGA